MSNNYHNWERLVEVVLRREQDREVALADSRGSSFSSISSSSRFRPDSSFHEQNCEVQLELPNGMENGFTNPSAHKFSMTSLEKVLKSGNEGKELVENGGEAKRREVIVRGVLSVTVISAEDLAPADLIGKADPYVVLIMKKTESKTKTKTRVVKNSLNPVWNQTFDFVVEDGLHDVLIIEVRNHDTFWKDYMGRCILTLTRVILEGEYKDTFPLDGAKSGTLNLYLKWIPLTGHPMANS